MTQHLLPDIDDPDAAPFWQGAARGELLFQRCADCGSGRFRPRPFCPRCASGRFDWVAAGGGGTVWSWVVVHPPTLPAFAALAPYPVGVVALDEDPQLRMVGNIVVDANAAINSVPLEKLRIGLPLRVAFRRVNEEIWMPCWVPQP